MRLTLEERFWSKVDKNGTIPDYRPDLGPCWLWTDAPHKHGYGVLMVDKKSRKAHHIAWLVTRGPLPKNIGLRKGQMVMDHLCRVRLCVRPDHLEWVTNEENTNRGFDGEWQRTKTHCPKGHPYSPENTRVKVGKDGYAKRICRTCDREITRRWRINRGLRDAA
jgi:hypothetical protein